MVHRTGGNPGREAGREVRSVQQRVELVTGAPSPRCQRGLGDHRCNTVAPNVGARREMGKHIIGRPLIGIGGSTQLIRRETGSELDGRLLRQLSCTSDRDRSK